MELFSGDYFLNFFMRYLHVLVGIAWIGLLYYFNLVQVPALATYGDEAKARNITLDRVARRALWWFRWAAIATLGTGILITGQPDYWQNFLNWEGANAMNAKNASITVGMIYAITMAANVWMVIWKNQKVVLANAVNLLNGGQADPNAAAAGRFESVDRSGGIRWRYPSCRGFANHERHGSLHCLVSFARRCALRRLRGSRASPTLLQRPCLQ